MEQSHWGNIRCLASVPILLMLTSSAKGLDINVSKLFQCSGVKIYQGIDQAACSNAWDMLNATAQCRKAGCGPPLTDANWAPPGNKPGWVRLKMVCQGTETSLMECPQNPGNCMVEATVTCSAPLLIIILSAATGGVLLVLLVACVAFWRRRRTKEYAYNSQIQYPPPEDHNSDDYEKMDYEKVVEKEEAEEEDKDEEPDYINAASKDNVHFVEIYGADGSDRENYENMIPTDKHEQFVEIYGEEDFIYQNVDSL